MKVKKSMLEKKHTVRHFCKSAFLGKNFISLNFFLFAKRLLIVKMHNLIYVSNFSVGYYIDSHIYLTRDFVTPGLIAVILCLQRLYGFAICLSTGVFCTILVRLLCVLFLFYSIDHLYNLPLHYILHYSVDFPFKMIIPLNLKLSPIFIVAIPCFLLFNPYQICTEEVIWFCLIDCAIRFHCLEAVN